MDGSDARQLQSGCCLEELGILLAFLIKNTLGLLAELCCGLFRIGCENDLLWLYITIGDVVCKQVCQRECLSASCSGADICYSFHNDSLIV